MADRAHSTSRRALLSGLAAVPLIGTLAIASAPHPDAELLRLGAELTQAADIELRLADEAELFDTPDGKSDWERAYLAASDIVDQIELAAPAATLAGLVVKARAVQWCHSGKAVTGESFVERPCTDIRIAAAIVADLLAMMPAHASA